MITRTYTYNGKIESATGYTSFCGCVDVKSWLPHPRQAWNKVMDQMVANNPGTERKQIQLLNFVRV